MFEGHINVETGEAGVPDKSSLEKMQQWSTFFKWSNEEIRCRIVPLCVTGCYFTCTATASTIEGGMKVKAIKSVVPFEKRTPLSPSQGSMGVHSLVVWTLVRTGSLPPPLF